MKALTIRPFAWGVVFLTGLIGWYSFALTFGLAKRPDLPHWAETSIFIGVLILAGASLLALIGPIARDLHARFNDDRKEIRAGIAIVAWLAPAVFALSSLANG